MPDEVLITKKVAALLKLAELDQWFDAQPRGGVWGNDGRACGVRDRVAV